MSRYVHLLLYTVYAQYRSDPLLEHTLGQSLGEGTVILGGDFNLILDPVLDSSRANTHISYTALKRTKKCFHQYQLIDIWQLIHRRVAENKRKLW